MSDNMETSQDQDTGMTDNNGDQNTQDNGKMFTQQELNDIIAKRIAQEQKKFEGIDVNEYRTLKEQQQQQEQERLMKREEFDKVLKQTKERYDGEISQLRSELEKVKIDGTLKSVASKLNTANPEHVAALLRNSVKLDETGNPVVVDSDGNVRYNTDTAEQFGIDDLVNEFVGQNPYFRSGGKPGTGAQGNRGNAETKEFDLTQLDMTKREDREKYAELKRTGKLHSR